LARSYPTEPTELEGLKRSLENAPLF
jgi:hypothetical protein